MQQHTIAVCPDCGKALEVLKACGAISYFCNDCNELKSSKRIQAVDPIQAKDVLAFPPKDSE